MQHVSNISIAVMYVMYFLAALFGYLTFYGEAWSSCQRKLLCHYMCSCINYVCIILCMRVCLCCSVTWSSNQKIILMHLHPLVDGLHIARAVFFCFFLRL